MVYIPLYALFERITNSPKLVPLDAFSIAEHYQLGLIPFEVLSNPQLPPLLPPQAGWLLKTSKL